MYVFYKNIFCCLLYSNVKPVVGTVEDKELKVCKL